MDWDGGDGERLGGRGGQGKPRSGEKSSREKRGGAGGWALGSTWGGGGGDVEEKVKSSRTPDTGKLVRAPPCPG